eukprot:gene122-72_t
MKKVSVSCDVALVVSLQEVLQRGAGPSRRGKTRCSTEVFWRSGHRLVFPYDVKGLICLWMWLKRSQAEPKEKRDESS